MSSSGVFRSSMKASSLIEGGDDMLEVVFVLISMKIRLYLAKFENPTTPLIPQNGTNFFNWSQNVKLALGVRTKLEFYDGSCARPTLGSRSLQKWIRGKISCSFAFVYSAQQLWTELVELFGQTNGPMLFQLRHSLVSIQQGNHSISDYFTAIKNIWDEVGSLEDFPQSECGVFLHFSCDLLKKVAEKDVRYQLIDFLMRLNVENDTLRNTILTTDPLSPLNKAF